MLMPYTGNGIQQNRPLNLPASVLMGSEAVSQPFTLPTIPPQSMSYQANHRPPPPMISSAFPVLPHQYPPPPHIMARPPYHYAPFNPYEISTQYHHSTTPLNIPPQHFIPPPPPTQSAMSSMPTQQPLHYSLSNPTTPYTNHQNPGL